MAKTALITGASQGIGACIAKTLAADGFNIAINCYSEREVENGGEAVAAACRELGVEAECFIADVSDFAASVSSWPKQRHKSVYVGFPARMARSAVFCFFEAFSPMESVSCSFAPASFML